MSFVKFRVYLSLITAALFLSGCAVPVVENYTQFQDKKYSPRAQAAEVFEGDITELMQNGYLLIGYLDFKHNIQKCHKGRGCSQISENEMTEDELLQRSANRGADKVQLLYSSLELSPDTFSVCNYYTTTTYTDHKGNVRTLTVCGGYSNYYGHMESWNKRALLWRYAPDLATADNNYQAVKQAQIILSKNEQQGQKKELDASPLDLADNRIETQPLSDDVYGAQLITAIENGNIQFLSSQLNSKKLNQWQQTYEADLLMLALELRQTTVYNWLIDQDVVWNIEDPKGYIAFEYTIAFAEPETVKSLLQKAPALEQRFKSKQRIYKALAMSESENMLAYLAGKGFSVNAKVEGYPLLVTATANENIRLVEQLLEQGARVNAYGMDGLTALETAVLRDNSDLVALLLEKGAKANQVDDEGNTALHYAAGYSSYEVTKALLEHGAKIDVFNQKKFSPLYTALLAGRWDVAELLMQQDAKYTIPNQEAFMETIRALLYDAPESTLDLYLKRTGILKFKELKAFNTSMLVACAEECDEEKINVFFENGVNLHFAPEGKSLFRSAYDKKNIGVLKAMIKRGYKHANPKDQLPRNIDFAVIAGDKVLVEAYRLAQVEQQQHAPNE